MMISKLTTPHLLECQNRATILMASTPYSENGNDNRVQAALRVLDLLECFERERRPLTLQEVATIVGVPVSSTFRLLVTLESRGFVEQNANGTYWLTSRLYNIGRVAVLENPLRQVTAPYLEKLHRRFDERIILGALARDRIVYVDTITPSHFSRLSAVIGGTCYIHSSSLGKAIAAYLSEAEVRDMVSQAGLPRLTRNTKTSMEELWEELRLTRERGYASNAGEMEESLHAFSVPLFNANKRPVGSLCVSGPAENMVRKDHELIIRALLEAGWQISKRLGYVPDPTFHPVYYALDNEQVAHSSLVT
jgi:IclR family acetate operon transcriptional repressor